MITMNIFLFSAAGAEMELPTFQRIRLVVYGSVIYRAAENKKKSLAHVLSINGPPLTGFERMDYEES